MPFPVGPTNGQIAIVNSISYTWNSTKGAWVRTPIANVAANVIISNTFTALKTVYATQSLLTQDLANTNAHLYTLGLFSSNTDQSVQLGAQNFANTSNASTDLALYNNLGTDTNNYIDMGITSTSYNVIINNFTASQPGDGYLYSNGVNLLIGTYTANTNLKIFVGGYNASNVVATFYANGITGNVATTSVSASSNVAIGYLSIPQNLSPGTNYTIQLSDQGKHLYMPLTSNANIIYIPASSSVPFPIGAAVNILINGAFSANVVANSGVTMYLAGNTYGSTTSTRLLSSYSMVSLVKVASDTWYIAGAGVS
jgi:hypothetical protein